MRRELLAVLILALDITLAGAHKTHEFRQGCIASLPLVLDNATLYRQVCMAMNQSVTAWNYSRDPASNGTHSNCVLVSYNALLGSFYDYPMQVTKSVCLSDEVVVESVTVKMAYIFYLNYTSRNEVHTNQMNFSTNIVYGVPWFFELLNYYIEDRILVKLRQNFAAWYEIICSQTPVTTLSFSSPPHTLSPKPSHGITAEDLLNVLFR
jgi:hypothetical protein